MPYTVKQAAEIAGVTVRTLHHYDAIGLLRPAATTSAGYRLYDEADMERLQQIRFFRELDVELEAIRHLLALPDYDRHRTLKSHRERLMQKRDRLGVLLGTLDRTLQALEGGRPMETKELFDGFDPAEYEEEAQARWGGSKEFQQSRARAKSYSQDDWQEIKGEMASVFQGLADLMDRDPASEEVHAAIGRWHRLIGDRFYDCSLTVFRGLADMYVADERFTRNLDLTRPGLAAFMRAAMHHYCDRLA